MIVSYGHDGLSDKCNVSRRAKQVNNCCPPDGKTKNRRRFELMQEFIKGFCVKDLLLRLTESRERRKNTTGQQANAVGMILFIRHKAILLNFKNRLPIATVWLSTEITIASYEI